MEITPIGFVVIPLSVLTLLFRPRYLGCWVVLLSPFQAASVLNISGNFPIGVSPYFFGCVMIALAFLPLWLSGRLTFERDDIALRIIHPMLIVTLWAVISAFLLPNLFAGVGVDAPRGGMDSPYTVPLRWTMSNAAQAGYICLNLIFFLFVLWRSSNESDFEKLIRAFIGAGLIAALIGAYQFGAHHLNLPYPSDFFNSNVTWRQLINERVVGIWRVSGTFSEPSVAGAFFAVWTTFFLFVTTATPSTSLWQWTMLLSGGGVLLLTASTTGYLTGSLMLILFSARELRRIITRGFVNPKALASLFCLACLLMGAVLLYNPDFGRLVSKLFLEKTISASGRDRLTTIAQSLAITYETWGLGVGLGSNRPSGMVFYLLSNIGIPGTLLFAYVIYVTFRSFTEVVVASERDSNNLLEGTIWAFGAALVGMAAAGGDMVSPMLWVSWGLLGAGIRAAASGPYGRIGSAFQSLSPPALFAFQGPPAASGFAPD